MTSKTLRRSDSFSQMWPRGWIATIASNLLGFGSPAHQSPNRLVPRVGARQNPSAIVSRNGLPCLSESFSSFLRWSPYTRTEGDETVIDRCATPLEVSLGIAHLLRKLVRKDAPRLSALNHDNPKQGQGQSVAGFEPRSVASLIQQPDKVVQLNRPPPEKQRSAHRAASVFADKCRGTTHERLKMRWPSCLASRRPEVQALASD